MTDDGQVVLILTPVDMDPMIAGAMEVDADCGHRAWISPSGLQSQLSIGATTTCIHCIDLDKLATGQMLEPSPEARSELADAAGSVAAAKMIRAMRDPTLRVAAARAMRSQRPRRTAK